MRPERTYHIWNNMMGRCFNKNRRDYKWYGKKGVTVCDEWQNYDGFKEWAIKSSYSDDLTLDRIDFNGNYEPNNCRWIPMAEQHANTSQTRLVTINGRTQPMKRWCVEYGISYQAVCQRVHRGMDNVSALLIPMKRRGEYGK